MMIYCLTIFLLLVSLGKEGLSYAKEALPKEFKFECIENKTQSKFSQLKPLGELSYDHPSVLHLRKKVGVEFFADLSQGKWGWVGMPVKAVWKDRIYCVSEENVGFFFEAVQTPQEAYELVTFVPSYWHRSLKSAEKDSGYFSVKVSALGLNRISKTTLTYRVNLNNTFQIIGNTNPEADPTDGVVF
jgi:hypothetical protein